MRISGKSLMILGIAILAGWATITALRMPFLSGIFCVVVGIAVFLMAMVDFCLRVFRDKTLEPFQFSENVERSLAIRRTLSVFMFIIGFFLIILFFGFPLAVPIFTFLHLKIQGKENWRLSLGLAAVASACFYGLFVWLLNTPFQEGWVQGWLKAFDMW